MNVERPLDAARARFHLGPSIPTTQSVFLVSYIIYHISYRYTQTSILYSAYQLPVHTSHPLHSFAHSHTYTFQSCVQRHVPAINFQVPLHSTPTHHLHHRITSLTSLTSTPNMKANIQPSSTLMTASLSSLPLPPPSQRIQSLLTHTPPSNPSKASTFLQTLHHAPSTQRRSTTFASGHLTNLTPLPIAFPYRLPVKIGDDGERVAAVGVEEWLTALEPLHHHHPHDQQQPSSQSTDSLSVYTSSARSWPTLLLAISPACLSETLPHLDVGDALDIVKTDLPAGSIAQDGEEPTHIHETGGDNAARDELIGVLGGREVLMNLDEGENGYKPWSLRYGGRQFGSWASQLGDGRAISLSEICFSLWSDYMRL